MARKAKTPAGCVTRTVTFTLNGVSLGLTATEGVLERLAALLLYARHEALANDPKWQATLDGPLVFGEEQPPEPELDAAALREDVARRLMSLIDKTGLEFAKATLREFGGEKLSDLEDTQLQALHHRLVESKV